MHMKKQNTKPLFKIKFSWPAVNDSWRYHANMMVHAATEEDAEKRAKKRLSYLTDTSEIQMVVRWTGEDYE